MIRIPFIYNLRSMKARWSSTLVAVLGIAGVVAVFLAMLSMARGFRTTLRASGSEDNAIIRRVGSISEMQSAVPLRQVKIIGDVVGIARDKTGTPIISPEVVVIASLPIRVTGNNVNALIRGGSRKSLEVRDRLKLTQGRFYNPGMAELVSGKNAATLYENVELGGLLTFGGQTWTVVGIFDADGSTFDSEIWCDANLLNQTYKRPTEIFQSITAKLASIEAFSEFKDALTVDPHITVDVEREITYYERQAEALTTLIRVLGYLVAFVMAIGAVFAALNTMYASVSARSSEISTLRALGFVEGNVVVSFLLESLAIAFLGGIVGCLLILPLNGFTASTTNFSTFSHLAFAFKVTPDLMVQGIIFALFMGFFGGLFPALHAAMQPIAGTLRGM